MVLNKIQKQMLGQDVQDEFNKIGDMSSLQTSEKGNLVGSLNEVNSQLAEKANQSDLETANSNIALKADITYVDTKAAVLANGAPKAVSLVSQMTDITKNYVYTGTETGYTAGHWYYWNGSAWADGGIYQSTSIGDKTVNTESLDEFTYGSIVKKKATNVFVEQGGLDGTTGGEIVSTTRARTKFIRIQKGVKISLSSYADYQMVVNLYSLGKALISGTGYLSDSYISDGEYYIRLVFKHTDGTVAITSTDLSNISSLITFDFPAILDQVVSLSKLSPSNAELLLSGNSYIDNWEFGTILSTDGSLAVSTTRIRTPLLKMRKGTYIKSTSPDVTLMVFTYDIVTKAFITALSTSYITDSTLIDDCYVRIVLRYNDNRTITNDTIPTLSHLCNVKLSYINSYYDFDFIGNDATTDRWEIGGTLSDGTDNPVINRARTIYLKMRAGTFIQSTDSSVLLLVATYTLSDKVYIENLQTGGYESRFIVPYDCYVRIVAKYADNSTITDARGIGKSCTIVKSYGNTRVNYDRARELLNKFSSTVDGQSICFVGDELWGFDGNTTGDTTTYANCTRYSLDFNTETIATLGTFTQNWGHVNTISYCPETDTLIVGNGSGYSSGEDSINKKFYILPNASNFKNLSTVPLETYGIEFDITFLNWGKQVQAIWGEHNNKKYNIAYILTNEGNFTTEFDKNLGNYYIHKILLGLGSTQLENGTFIAGKAANEFNGTFKVLATYTGENYYTSYECTQNAIYYNGKIYTGLGHDGIWIAEITLKENGTFDYVKTRERNYYNDDGTKVTLYLQALTIKDDQLYVKVWEYENNKGNLNVYKL